MYSPDKSAPKQEWSLGPGMPRRTRQYGSSIDALIAKGKQYAPVILAVGAGMMIGYAASLTLPSDGKEYRLSLPYTAAKK
jgi:hypothetical protein